MFYRIIQLKQNLSCSHLDITSLSTQSILSNTFRNFVPFVELRNQQTATAQTDVVHEEAKTGCVFDQSRLRRIGLPDRASLQLFNKPVSSQLHIRPNWDWIPLQDFPWHSRNTVLKGRKTCFTVGNWLKGLFSCNLHYSFILMKVLEERTESFNHAINPM